jgi:alpha-beta hydrolase superfamily lysophospholipase
MHQRDPQTLNGTVLDRLMNMMATEGAGKQIFLCGHSMGGALASFLALLLTAR